MPASDRVLKRWTIEDLRREEAGQKEASSSGMRDGKGERLDAIFQNETCWIQ